MEENKRQKHIVIFTGGKSPSYQDTAKYWKAHKIDAVIAADSGLDTCMMYQKEAESAMAQCALESCPPNKETASGKGIADSEGTADSSQGESKTVPFIVVGDFDSVSDKVRYGLKGCPPNMGNILQGAQVEQCDRAKDLSDTEIALRKAREIDSAAFVTLVGADGGRLDHLIAVFDTFSTSCHADVWLLQQQKAVYLKENCTAAVQGLAAGDIVSTSRLMGNRGGGTFKTEGLVWGGEHFRMEGMPSLSNWVRALDGGNNNDSGNCNEDGRSAGAKEQGAEVKITALGCAALVICPHWADVKIIEAEAGGKIMEAADSKIMEKADGRIMEEADGKIETYREAKGEGGEERDDALSRLMAFSAEIDKMTHIARRTMLLDLSRRENDAEHSWHIGMMALIFAQYMEESVDKEHAVSLCLAHDLVEIYAGDTFAFDKAGYETKAAREEQAAERLFAMLPAQRGREIRALWDEFEEGRSAEAKLANCMDRLQPFLHNTLTGGYTWVEGKVCVSDVLRRMQVVKECMSKLWPWIEGKIAEAVEKGQLING